MPSAGAYKSPTHTPPPQQAYADPYYSQGNTNNAYAFSTGDNAYGSNQYGYGTAAYSNTAPRHDEQDRSYTLGGGGYGHNVVPDHSSSPQPATSGTTGGGAAYSSPYGTPGLSTSPPPMPASLAAGPRSPTHANSGQTARQESYEDSPPGYEPGVGGSTTPAVQVPAWGAKT